MPQILIARDSVNKPYFSNNALCNRAGIPRIDNYIIKLTRDYMANLANNNYMSEFASIMRSSAINTAATGYISPHSFMYYDKKQLIQNSNIPIIYHTVRHKANKALDFNIPDERLIKYSIAIPDVDKHTNHRNNKKYWWLNNNQQKLAIVEGRLADN
ncbi:hypothetical protein TKK_0019232 [Trichogramma kaykai]|uniref:Uncharacterized protein n=1 Tax=Trichogramma kaykai TaxID=54128 RepID=A0ABD2VTP6_9HYME